MENVNLIDLTNLIEALLELAFLALVVIVIPWAKAKLSNEQEAKLLTIFEIAVMAAEKLYGAGKGDEKLKYVESYLAARGVKVDEMRKEFLSNVTHELKTPIALIQGYAEGLKDNITEDLESREFYCDVIIDEASKMNKMVKKLLTLNQLEFGNGMVEMERFDIVALVRSVLESSDILIKQNEIQLLFQQSEPMDVWADEYMIEEVVTNYLTNAIHYATNEKVIDIRVRKNENTVRVSVFNTGDPIPEADIDKIWIKFYKVDKARTREYGGNGIGLSIVKAIMEAHNKRYGVINHSNGVEFWFELDG